MKTLRPQRGFLDFDAAFRALAIACVLIGFVLAAAVFVAGPWLWEIVRPWLHAITA